MNSVDLISRRINALMQLPDEKEVIYISDLRKEFRQDLKDFVAGETLSMKDGKIIIGKNLYKKWLQKIKTKGFGYDVKFI